MACTTKGLGSSDLQPADLRVAFARTTAIVTDSYDCLQGGSSSLHKIKSNVIGRET